MAVSGMADQRSGTRNSIEGRLDRELERCRAEQRRARDESLADPTSLAWLGVQDWLKEEILILTDAEARYQRAIGTCSICKADNYSGGDMAIEMKYDTVEKKYFCLYHVLERQRQAESVRKFETGATRDSDSTKPDFDGYLSPLVLERFGEYMTLHRKLPDGTTRDSDNWKKGIPRDAYMKSMWRHFMDVYTSHHGGVGREDLETALCAMLFNVQGYLHEVLKERNYKK